MNTPRWLIRVVVASALTLGLVGLSRVSWAPTAAGQAELRLAGRFKSALVDECHRLSAAELAKLPVHMRREVSCERRLMPYRLTVALDGVQFLDDTVRARGARADRPLSFYRDVRLDPGAHTLAVWFTPLMPAAQQAAPPAFALDTTLIVAPYQVLLVTLDEARGRLVVR